MICIICHCFNDIAGGKGGAPFRGALLPFHKFFFPISSDLSFAIKKIVYIRVSILHRFLMIYLFILHFLKYLFLFYFDFFLNVFLNGFLFNQFSFLVNALIFQLFVYFV